MGHEAQQGATSGSRHAASDGLSDHPQAVYMPPPGLDAALDRLPLVEVGAGAPKRIGYLTNYSFHIWYQILIEIIRRRAAQYGATVTVLDAELSVERQIQQAQQPFRQHRLQMTPFRGLEKRSPLRLPLAWRYGPMDASARTRHRLTEDLDRARLPSEASVCRPCRGTPH